MATVKLVPTSAVITNWDIVGGSDTDVLGDEDNGTYMACNVDDTIPSLAHMTFTTDSVYVGKPINNIQVHIEGKVMSAVSPSIQTFLTCTERGEEGIHIQSTTTTYLSGIINTTFTFTTLAHPLTDTEIDSGHIDTLDFNLIAPSGLVLISELYVIVDYSEITAGRIEMNSGFLELMEGHLALQ